MPPTRLPETTDTLISSLGHLAEQSLPAESVGAIDALRRDLDSSGSAVDPVELADREEALFEWLDSRGVEAAWRVAPPLAVAGAEVEWCERAAEVLTGDALEPGLEWVASTIATRDLLAEVKESTGRITTS